MAVDIGTVVQAMVIDTLSGRSPLYMLEEFVRNQDTGVLLGCEVSPGSFNNTTVGRAMYAIYSACTEKVFSQVAFRAASEFAGELDMRHVHFDTTSISVWGDKYPAGEDGNASDVRGNNRELTRLSGYMATHGLSPRAFVYVAASAMVNRDNLEVTGDSNLFITRLPFRYGESDRLVEQAVCADAWTEVPSESGRPSARYRVWESAVELYGKAYRAVVVHSDAHDKRRLHRLDRRLKESLQKASDSLRKAVSVEYFCREDAEAAMGRLLGERTGYHSHVLRIREQVIYARGRPSKEGRRRVSSVRYMIEGEIVECMGERCFAAPLTPVQERYLEVLGLDADSLLCYSNRKGTNEEL